jgi:hypothetical protein
VGTAAPRLSSRAKPRHSRDSAHLATASDDGLVIKAVKRLKWVVIPRRALSSRNLLSARGSQPPAPHVLFPIGPRPSKSRATGSASTRETGRLANWTTGGVYLPFTTTVQKHSGAYSAQLGASSGSEPNGDSSLYQAITIPSTATKATLTFWYWPSTTDTITYDWRRRRFRTAPAPRWHGS